MLINRIVFLAFIAIFITACAGSDSPFASAGASGSGSGSGGSGGGNNGETIGFGNLTNESHINIDDSLGQRHSIKLSDDGNTVVFLSEANLTGSNADEVNQVFSIINGILAQVTSFTTATIGLPASVIGFAPNISFVMSGNGSTLAWISSKDPLGTNADNASQIFISDLSGTVTQLTNITTPRFIEDLDISNDGNTIAFTSTADLDAGQNTGLNLQIFTLNTGTMAINQVTTGTVGNDISLRLSGDGTTIGFTSFNDWVGGGANQDRQVFTINVDGTGLIQQTTFAASHLGLRISNDGLTIVFSSSGDLTGNNSEHFAEIFSLNTTTQVVIQLTSGRNLTVYRSIIFLTHYDISGDGTTLIYPDGDGENDPISLKSINLATLTVTVLVQASSTTSSDDHIDIPAINIDGTKSVFMSTFDFSLTLIGEAAEQIYSYQ